MRRGRGARTRRAGRRPCGTTGPVRASDGADGACDRGVVPGRRRLAGGRGWRILAGVRSIPVLVALIGGLVAADAAADGVPDGMAGIGSDFSVLNLAEFPEYVFVTYPGNCDWKTRRPWGLTEPDKLEDPDAIADYLVITDGVNHASGYCMESLVYALDRKAFTLLPRPPSPSPDEFELPIPIAELAAMTPGARAAFFAGEDPRKIDTGRQLQPTRWVISASERLRHVHDVLRVVRVGEGLALRCAAVRYTYEDDTEEEVPCLTDERPPPTGRGRPRHPPQLSMVSSIPRWPFIAAAGLVFLVMVALGLRRRRA